MPDLNVRTLWRLVRHAVVFEIRLYRSLFRWITRRPHIPGPDLEPFGYARDVTPVMWLWIFASAAEIPLVHVLIPWDTVRITLLVLGVWGVVWMVGMLASLRVYPHLLSESAIRVRYGASVDIPIPWEAIATIVPQRRDLPSTVWTLQPREIENGTDLQVGVSGQVNVHAVLHEPMTVTTHKGDQVIAAISFRADDPRDLVARARQHLAPAGAERRTRDSA